MRLLLLFMLLAGSFAPTQAQSLFEYKEEIISGRVVAYRLLVDFPPIFGSCFAFPENDLLLVERISASPDSEHPFILVRSPKRLSSVKQFGDGKLREFKVWRWIGCDEVAQRATMRIPEGVNRKSFPDRKWLPCYISEDPIRDK